MAFRGHGIATPLYDIGTLLTLVTSFMSTTVVLEGVQRRKFLAEDRGWRFPSQSDHIFFLCGKTHGCRETCFFLRNRNGLDFLMCLISLSLKNSQCISSVSAPVFFTLLGDRNPFLPAYILLPLSFCSRIALLCGSVCGRGGGGATLCLRWQL